MTTEVLWVTLPVNSQKLTSFFLDRPWMPIGRLKSFVHKGNQDADDLLEVVLIARLFLEVVLVAVSCHQGADSFSRFPRE